jgi:hypothetical protein
VISVFTPKNWVLSCAARALEFSPALGGFSYEGGGKFEMVSINDSERPYLQIEKRYKKKAHAELAMRPKEGTFSD